MYYGDEKRLQMARSILPSTKRGIPGDRRRIHKRERAALRADLHRALHAPDLEGWAEDSDPGIRRRRELRTLVDHRRVGDKLGGFFRWSEAVTRHLPAEGRLAFVQAVLPPGLIGEHAISHLEQRAHFESPNEATIRALRREWWMRRADPERTREARSALLRELVIDGEAHRLLNAELRAAAPEGQTARLLHGLGDIDAFLDACEVEREAAKRLWPKPVLRVNRVDAFLDRWETRGRDTDRVGPPPR